MSAAEAPVAAEPTRPRRARRELQDALADAAESRGRPLDDELRRDLEARLGVDLGGVRLHDDVHADASARALDARAFTIGREVFFASGELEPATVDGRLLLVHELAHTAQHRGIDGAAAIRTESVELAPDARLEHEARQAAGGLALTPAPATNPGVAPLHRLVAAAPVLEPSAPGADAFVERVARDVARVLERDPADPDRRTRQRLARLAPETRTAVVGRAQQLLPPTALERAAGALTGAVAHEEQPAGREPEAREPRAAVPQRAAEPGAAPEAAPVAAAEPASAEEVVPASAPGEAVAEARAEGAAVGGAEAAEPPVPEGTAPAASGEPSVGASIAAAASSAAPSAAASAEADVAPDLGPVDEAERQVEERYRRREERARRRVTEHAEEAGVPTPSIGAEPAPVADTPVEAAAGEAAAEVASTEAVAKEAPATAPSEEPDAAATETARDPALPPVPEPGGAPPEPPPEVAAAGAAPPTEEPEPSPAADEAPPTGVAEPAEQEPAAGQEPAAEQPAEPEAPEAEAPRGETEPEAAEPAAAAPEEAASPAAAPEGAERETAPPDGEQQPDAAGEPQERQEQEEEPGRAEPAAEAEADGEADGAAPPPAAGGGGGASAIEEQPTPEDPDVSQSEPADAMQAAESLPPGRMARMVSRVRAAARGSVARQRSELQASPPSADRPSGAPQAYADERPAGCPTPPSAQAAAPTVERAAERPAAAVPGPAQLPPAPPPPTQTVAPPPVGSSTQGQVTANDAQAIAASVRALPVNDPALEVTAGPAPRVALAGDADPARAQEQRTALDRSTGEVHAQGRADAAQPLGEDSVYPSVPHETLQAEVPGDGEAAEGGEAEAGGDEAPDPAESAVAEEQSGDQVRGAASAAQGDIVATRDEHATRVAEHQSASQEQMDAETRRNADEQTAERQRAQGEAAQRRGEWSRAQQDAVDDNQRRADDGSRRAATQVEDRRAQADSAAAAHVDRGNQDAAGHRRRAEQDAAAERRRGEQRTQDSGFLGWLASQATAFFNEIKRGIQAVFDAARRAVRWAIEQAQRLAAEVIDAARRAIVGLIRAAAEALMALADELLAAFPGLRDRFRALICRAVEAAVAAVNRLANLLKEAVQRLLNLLGQLLDAALRLLMQAYLAAVNAVAAAARRAIQAARSFLQGLAAFIQVGRDIAANPAQWLRNLGAAALDGVRNHLWRAFRIAVKRWFRSKVEEVLGLPLMLFNLLRRGGIRLGQIASMVWRGLVAAIPGILIQLAIEKIVALIIPAAALVMQIIEALQAAWGTISRIIAAIESFIRFLLAVKLGNAGRQFGTMVANAAVVVLDFLANFLVRRLMRPARPVGGRLSAIAQRLAARFRRVAQAVQRGVGRVVQTVRRAAQAVRQVAVRAAQAVRRAAVGVARAVGGAARRAAATVARGARRAWGAITRTGGRVMRVIERRFPRVARVLHAVGRAGRRVGAGLRRGYQRTRAWVQRQRERFREWRQRRREERQRRALERLREAVAAVRPRALALLHRGVGRARWTFALLGWTLQYRLSSLRMRGRQLIARINPELPADVTPEDVALGTELERVLQNAEEAFLTQMAIRHPERIEAVEDVVGHARQRGAEPLPELSSVQQALFFRMVPEESGRFMGLRAPRLFGASRASFAAAARRQLQGWRVPYPTRPRPRVRVGPQRRAIGRLRSGSYADIEERVDRLARMLGADPERVVAAASAPSSEAQLEAAARLVSGRPRAAAHPRAWLATVEELQRLGLVRAMESGRQPGQIAFRTLATAVGGTPAETLTRDPMARFGSGTAADVATGRIRSELPESWRENVEQATAVRRARITQMFRRLQQRVANATVLTEDGNQQAILARVRNAFEHLVSARAPDADPDHLVELERRLTIEIIAFLQAFHGEGSA